MLKKYKKLGSVKNYLIYVLCDETFSILSSAKVPEGVNRKWFYFWVSFLDYSYWVITSVTGGFLGSVITVNTKGLDFVLTALFAVIFTEQLKILGSRISALVGAACSVICLFVFGPKNFIIPSMLAILFVLTIMKGRFGGLFREGALTEAGVPPESETGEAGVRPEIEAGEVEGAGFREVNANERDTVGVIQESEVAK